MTVNLSAETWRPLLSVQEFLDKTAEYLEEGIKYECCFALAVPLLFFLNKNAEQ